MLLVALSCIFFLFFFFFFNDTATTEIYTLSLTRRSSDLPGSGSELRLHLLRNVTEPGKLSAHRIGHGLDRICCGLHSGSETVDLGTDDDAGFNIGHDSLSITIRLDRRLRCSDPCRSVSRELLLGGLVRQNRGSRAISPREHLRHRTQAQAGRASRRHPNSRLALKPAAAAGACL